MPLYTCPGFTSGNCTIYPHLLFDEPHQHWRYSALAQPRMATAKTAQGKHVELPHAAQPWGQLHSLLSSISVEFAAVKFVKSVLSQGCTVVRHGPWNFHLPSVAIVHFDFKTKCNILHAAYMRCSLSKAFFCAVRFSTNCDGEEAT